MPITYNERFAARKNALFRLLFGANLGFAALILISWQSALPTVLGPIGWAADQPIPASRELLYLFEYPLILYWLAPTVSMLLARVMLQSHRYRAAFGVLTLPLLVMSLTMLMYIYVPDAGR